MNTIETGSLVSSTSSQFSGFLFICLSFNFFSNFSSFLSYSHFPPAYICCFTLLKVFFLSASLSLYLLAASVLSILLTRFTKWLTYLAILVAHNSIKIFFFICLHFSTSMYWSSQIFLVSLSCYWIWLKN